MLRSFAMFLGLCLAILSFFFWPAAVNAQQDFFSELFGKGSFTIGSDKVLPIAICGLESLLIVLSIQVAPLDLGSLGGSGGGGSADPFAGLFGGRRR